MGIFHFTDLTTTMQYLRTPRRKRLLSRIPFYAKSSGQRIFRFPVIFRTPQLLKLVRCFVLPQIKQHIFAVHVLPPSGSLFKFLRTRPWVGLLTPTLASTWTQ